MTPSSLGPNRGRIARLLDERQGRGRFVVSLDEAATAGQLSRLAAHRQLQRLAPHVTPLPGRPTAFLIVPPEHRLRGAPSLSAWLDDYCRIRGIPYYVGLLSAAALHGSEAQAVQTTQIMTTRPQRSVSVGRTTLDFHVKTEFQTTPLSQPPGLAAPLAVSSPEATALDLIEFNYCIGGMRRALEVIEGLTPKMTTAGWRSALHDSVPVTVLQRLGYVLELLELKKYAALVQKSLPQRFTPTVLQTRSTLSRARPIAPFQIVDNLNLWQDRQ